VHHVRYMATAFPDPAARWMQDSSATHELLPPPCCPHPTGRDRSLQVEQHQERMSDSITRKASSRASPRASRCFIWMSAEKLQLLVCIVPMGEGAGGWLQQELSLAPAFSLSC